MTTRIRITFFSPGTIEGRTIDGVVGESLMRAAVAAGVEGIAADCGGTLTCATCHVHVRDPWLSRLPPPAADEEAMLEFTAEDHDESSRLSCQVRLTEALEGMEIDLPVSQY